MRDRRIVQAWILGFLLWVMSGPAAAQPQAPDSSHTRLGVSYVLGPTFNFLGDVRLRDLKVPDTDDLLEQESYPMRLGYQAGLVLLFERKGLDLRTSLIFLNAGALFNGSSFLEEDDVRVAFITASIGAQWTRPFLGLGADFYLFGGPQLRYRLDVADASRDFRAMREHLRPLSAAADVGAGLRLRRFGFYFGPEVRYGLDLTGLSPRGLSLPEAAVEVRQRFRLNDVKLGLTFGR